MRTVKINSDAISDIGCNSATGVIIEYFINKNISNVKYYFNANTLYRNFMGCLDGTAKDKIQLLKPASNIADVIDLFITDTTVIINACIERNIDIKIYRPDYNKLSKKFGNPIDRNKFKGLRYTIASIQKDILDAISTEMSGVFVNETMLPYTKGMYVTTHVGMELLNFTRLQDVKLIESHTAEVKSFNKWYTKLYKLPNKDMSIVPFNKVTYKIMGDGDYIASADIKIRKAIYDAAIAMKWNSNTPDVRVMSYIKMKMPGILEPMLAFMRKVF